MQHYVQFIFHELDPINDIYRKRRIEHLQPAAATAGRTSIGSVGGNGEFVGRERAVVGIDQYRQFIVRRTAVRFVEHGNEHIFGQRQQRRAGGYQIQNRQPYRKSGFQRDLDQQPGQRTAKHLRQYIFGWRQSGRTRWSRRTWWWSRRSRWTGWRGRSASGAAAVRRFVVELKLVRERYRL